MQHLLIRIRTVLVGLEEKACGVLLLAMTAVISYGMFERFVIRHGVGWTDEVSRYISIWAIFLGASLGIVRGAHIGVEVFVRLLPESLQEVAYRVGLIVCTLFTGSLAYFAYLYFVRILHSGQLTPALQVPLCWAFSAVPVGLCLMSLHFLIQLFLPKEV